MVTVVVVVVVEGSARQVEGGMEARSSLVCVSSCGCDNLKKEGVGEGKRYVKKERENASPSDERRVTHTDQRRRGEETRRPK